MLLCVQMYPLVCTIWTCAYVFKCFLSLSSNKVLNIRLTLGLDYNNNCYNILKGHQKQFECTHIFFLYGISCFNRDYVSVFNWSYVTTDVTIPLVIYIIFSMIIKQSLFNLN